MRAIFWVTSLTSLAISSAAIAAERAPISGVYSDLRYIPEAGDLLGTEIRISRSHGHYRAAVQVAEGVPTPVITIPVDVAGDEVHFTVQPIGGYTYQYSGRITPSGFVGSRVVTTSTQSVVDPLLLPRKRHSYWEK